jgi:hypothetical protein
MKNAGQRTAYENTVAKHPFRPRIRIDGKRTIPVRTGARKRATLQQAEDALALASELPHNEQRVPQKLIFASEIISAALP